MCDGNADHKVVQDKVVSICPRDGWVTLQLTLGFTFSKPILYLSTEANDPLVVTLVRSDQVTPLGPDSL